MNGFWNSEIFQSDCRDFHKRSCIGLQRSSPKYFNPHLKNMADCYFNGTFSNPKHIEMLIEIEKESRERLTIEDVLKRYKSTSKAYYATDFNGCLNAYLHSPIQRQKERTPIYEKEAHLAFKALQNRMKPKFFVQKVNFDELKRWPKSSIVSFFSYIFTYILALSYHHIYRKQKSAQQ